MNDDGKPYDDAESAAGGGVCRPSVGRTSAGDAPESDAPATTDEGSDAAGIMERLETIREQQRQQEGVPEVPAELFEGEAGPFRQSERLETKLRWEGPGKIVYDPMLYQTGPEQYSIEAKREQRGLIPWGFWGGLLFAGIALAVLAGANNIYSFWDILWAVVGLTVAALMYRYGRKSTMEETLLCELDGRRRTLHWPEGATSGVDETLLSFDDVTEVVFGMTKLPVDERNAGVRVDAFALLVRTADDELIPVVEGSPYKGQVNELAKFVSEMTGAHLSYVGRGIK